MRKSFSALPLALLEQRAKWNGLQLYMFLLLMAILAAFSGFFLGSPAQHAITSAIKFPGEHFEGLIGTSDAGGAAAHAVQTTAAAAAAAGPGSSHPATSSCHTEANAEYSGEDVIVWGTSNMKDTAGECCESCRQHQAKGCNAWVWCGQPSGCEGGRQYRECWLKRQRDMNILDIAARRGPGVPWTSGALYPDADRTKLLQAEALRLQQLRNDEELPLVYLDVAIKGRRVGRITAVLFTKEAPRAAENFRQLCTGESGTAPPGAEGAGKQRHFKGNGFYRIIDQFIDQAGAWTDSVFGGQFKDDPSGLKLKHDRKGLLSMANAGPDTNTSHFSIMLGPAPHLNGHYTIFGEVVEGFEVVKAINALSKGKKDNTATADEGAVIVDSGQLRKGSYKPDLNQM